MKLRPQILHEDEQLVVVNKPPHLLTIPDRYCPEKPNLYHYLNQQYQKVWVLHRLDKETSGVLVFAKNAEVHRILSLQFERHEIEKNYLALVSGRVSPEKGKIDQPISPHPSDPSKRIVSKKGKPSVSEYEVEEYFGNFSLLKVRILTGRTHQIRVHLESIGYPLAVDPVYGKAAEFFLSNVKGQQYKLGRGKEERPLMSRSSLHSWRLKIQHPLTNRSVQFEAPLPKDLKAVIRQLRKWDKSQGS